MATRKGNWKPKSKEEKQKELDDLIELSNKKIEQYQSNPEDMIEFAKFMSKIHNYSPLNLSLIDEQFHGAIAVASYEGWKKQGFSVQRGEKGIGIYTHAPVTVFTNKEGEEKTLREATNEEKALISSGELASKKIKHFKKGYVYDVSQTNATAEDLPKIFPNRVWNFELEGENNIEQLENGVLNLASSIGIDIKDMKESIIGELGSARGAYVQYLGGQEEIALNSRNSRTQNLATSIHELAHKKLHNEKEEGANYSKAIKEFQAEMTSFIVCNNYGMDTSEKAIPYIAQWTQNNEKIEPKLFRQVMSDVKSTAVEFIEVIDKSIIDERQVLEKNKEQAQEGLNALKNSFALEESKEQKREQLIFRNQIFTKDDFDKFSNGNFDNARFEECTFDKILLDHSSFKNTVFTDCKFEFVDLSNSDLKDSTIYYTEFNGGSLKNSSLENATIRSTKINGTNLSNTDLLSATFEDVSFDEIKIGQSLRNLQTVGMYVRGGTREENQRYEDKVMPKLDKENFNHEFKPDKMELSFNKYYQEEQPRNLSSYFDQMVAYYHETLGYDKNVLQVEEGNDYTTATIGKNYVVYYNDTKQFDICDLYGVTAGNTSVDEHDRLLLDRSPENCNYVEAFLKESVKAYEKYEIVQEQSFEHEGLSVEEVKPLYTEPLRAVVINDSANNLSETPERFHSLSAWHDELSNQSDIETIDSLKTVGSIDDFYNMHKQEIENKVDDFVAVTNIDVRQGLSGQEYKDQTATIAYRLTANTLKSEVETGGFEIPQNDLLVNQSQNLEME